MRRGMTIRYYVILVAMMLAGILSTGVGLTDSSESGLFEVLQLAVLIITFCSWLMVAKLQRYAATSHHHFFRLCALFIALLAFVLLGRETSWLRIWDMHYLWGVPVKWTGITIAITCLMAIMWRWVKGAGDKKRQIVALLSLASFWLIPLAACWLLLGQAFEELHTALAHSQYYEELSELIAYVTLLYASMVFPNTQSSVLARAKKRYKTEDTF